jgi:protein-tyrosine-phosphatase
MVPSMIDRSSVYAALGDTTRLAIVDELWLTDDTPGALGERLGLRSNLLAHHLDVLDQVGLIDRIVSAQDRRHRYVRLNRDRLPVAYPGRHLSANQVLFVCTHNAARSQWAAALWEALVGKPAESAGTKPARRVDPLAAKVARRHHIDLSATSPKGWDRVSHVPDLVVTVCDRARESDVPIEAPTLHWSVPDPVGSGRISTYERAFADIARRVDNLAAAREDAPSV